MKYEELRRLAEAATPGPWWHAKSISYRAVATLHRNERPELIPGEGATGEATAAYIAAASPDVILALLDERERLLEALRETRPEPWEQEAHVAYSSEATEEATR